MRHEMLSKLRTLIGKHSLSESEVQHLFTLARKLIEDLPQIHRQNYTLLKFYCDWTLHREIDRSVEGAQILAHVHSIIIDHLRKQDNSAFAAELTDALSLERVREQINTLLTHTDNGYASTTLDESKWRRIVPIVAEIISHCPLKIGRKTPNLNTFLQSIRSRPIKGSSVVEQIMVAKIPTSYFNHGADPSELIYCFVITTSDTTKIITPLVKS